MDRFNLVRTVALTLMTAGVTAACDGGSGPSASECRTFRTTLSVEDRMSQGAGVFNPGEPITFELQIANMRAFIEARDLTREAPAKTGSPHPRYSGCPEVPWARTHQGRWAAG